MKRKILFFILGLLLLLQGFSFAQLDQEKEFTNIIVRGTILEASEAEQVEDAYFKAQKVKVRIDSGERKGTVMEIENSLSDHQYYDIIVKKGDKVSLMLEEFEDGTFNLYIADYYRINSLYLLVGLFVVLVVIIGGFKGFKSLVSLGITIAAVLFIMIPLILKGMNPILVSVVTAIFVTLVTIFLVTGINHKSYSAIIGTSVGVIIAGVIAYIVGTSANLSGLSAEEATMLMFIPQGIEFNFRQLLFAGIIMGALGAAMDVGISISSSIDEIHNANPTLTSRRLFKAGMNVGKDVMGTMVNTLILAYTGASIPMLLLFTAHNTELGKVFNLDVVATEVVRSLSGSIGLILTIPITAFVASRLVKSSKKISSEVDTDLGKEV